MRPVWYWNRRWNSRQCSHRNDDNDETVDDDDDDDEVKVVDEAC